MRTSVSRQGSIVPPDHVNREIDLAPNMLWLATGDLHGEYVAAQPFDRGLEAR